MELAKYNTDIAAQYETRFSESRSLHDLEYSFFWSDTPEGERMEDGVGLAIKKDIYIYIYIYIYISFHGLMGQSSVNIAICLCHCYVSCILFTKC